MPQPQPGNLDHDRSQPGIAGLGDALVPMDRSALPRRGGQPGISRNLLSVRIRCGITASILLFVPSPSHGLISLVPWDSTASVADLETVAVNSPRILTVERSSLSLRLHDRPGA